MQPVEGSPPGDHVPATQTGQPAPPKPGWQTGVIAGPGTGREWNMHERAPLRNSTALLVVQAQQRRVDVTDVGYLGC